MTHHQSFTPTILCVSGASITSLAAYIYLSRHPPPETGRPVRFTNQDITLRFVSSIPEIAAELNLELAMCRQIETFTQTDEYTLLWGMIDLGKNIAQVSVPVTYRYHVHLRDAWKLETQGNLVIVYAPALQPSLPPAIHTDQLTTLSVRGWGRRSPATMIQELEHQLTPRLTALASDPRRLNLVRDACRKSVAEFVRLWLERERQWGKSGFTQIQVKFADEAALPPSPHPQIVINVVSF